MRGPGRVHVLPGAGHWVQQQEPQEVNRRHRFLLVEFLERLRWQSGQARNHSNESSSIEGNHADSPLDVDGRAELP